MDAGDREFLNRINDFASKNVPDIDPKSLQPSDKLNKLRPVLQMLAMENGMSVEDVFIKYMDLSTQNAAKYADKMNTDSLI